MAMKQPVVSRNPEVMGGVPVFCGTRVPADAARLPWGRRIDRRFSRRFPVRDEAAGHCLFGASEGSPGRIRRL